MNVTLYHPRHGTKVAIAALEIEQDMKHGWRREPLAEPLPENALRRRGRPRKDEVRDDDSR